MRPSGFLLSLCLLLACVPVLGQDGAGYRGRTVQSVLDELRGAGAPLVYSTNLVPPTLLVDSEPRGTEPLEIAREILEPHGLAIQQTAEAWLVVRGAAGAAAPTGTGGIVLTVVSSGATPVADARATLDDGSRAAAPVVDGRVEFRDVAPGRHVVTVRAPGFLPQRASVSVSSGAAADATVSLSANAPPLEELIVTASLYEVRNDVRPSTSYFSREQIESLSYLGDDAMRIVHRLPGVATTDFSARSHVRGGAVDEMTVFLDGMKLMEPFHLRDYQSVFSAVDQRIVSGIQIYSGGFPAEYGDALSGLTIMDRVEPTEPLHTELGLSLLYTSGLSSGTFLDGRGQWLVSARVGNIDALLNEELGNPRYRDAFAHVAMALGAKHKIAANHIGYDDDVLVIPDDSPGNLERGRSDTDNKQTWLTLDSDWTEDLTSRTLVYSTAFGSGRQGAINDVDEIVGFASDNRSLDEQGIKQDWRWSGAEHHRASWGFEYQDVDTQYSYSSAVELRGVLSTLDDTPTSTRVIQLAPSGASHSAYVSDRWRITERFIADLGLRWDRQTYLPAGDDEQFSPRSSFLYRAGAQTDLRFSYGRYFQSEGALDLQVEDGVVDFAPAQNASHSIVGVEHRFPGNLALRGELFRKWTSSARPRYENLYDPLVILPELRPGRTRVAPDRADSRGIEVLLSSDDGAVSWWLSYAYSEVDDVIAGAHVPRGWDQRHALNGGATWSAGPWSLSAVGTIHSGWPWTTLSLEPSSAPNAVDGVVAVPGARNAENLPVNRRVDFRTSRTFEAGPGSVRFFAELTNVTNRKNVCCVLYEPITVAGQPALNRVERAGLPLILNVGALWQF
jgi:hypothetical protein